MAALPVKCSSTVGDCYLSEMFGDMRTAQEYIKKYPFENILLKVYNKNFDNPPISYTCATSDGIEECSNDYIHRTPGITSNANNNYILKDCDDFKTFQSIRSQNTKANVEESPNSSSNQTRSLVLQGNETAMLELYQNVRGNSPIPDRPTRHIDTPYPDVSSSWSTTVFDGTPTSRKENAGNIAAGLRTLDKQNCDAGSLRRSKRNRAPRRHGYMQHSTWQYQKSFERLSTVINGKVNYHEDRSEKPAKEDTPIGKGTGRFLGETKESTIMRNGEQSSECKIPIEDSNDIPEHNEIERSEKKEMTEREYNISNEGENCSLELPLREGKGTTMTGNERMTLDDNRRATVNGGENTGEHDCVRLDLTGGEQETLGNIEETSADVKVLKYNSLSQSSCNHRSRSFDQEKGSEEQLQGTSDIDNKRLQKSENKLGLPHKWNRPQLQLSSLEVINIESKRECDVHDLNQSNPITGSENVNENQSKEQMQETPTPELPHRYDKTNGDLHQGKDRTHAPVVKCKRVIIDSNSKPKSNNMNKTIFTHGNYRSKKESPLYRAQGKENLEYATCLQEIDDSNDKARQNYEGRNDVTKKMEKDNAFNQISECKTDHRIKCSSNRDSRQSFGRNPPRHSTENSLRMQELEHENSRLKKEIEFLQACLDTVSDAVHNVKKSLPCETLTPDSDASDEDSSTTDTADEKYRRGYDKVRVCSSEFDSHKPYQLYEDIFLTGGRRGRNIREAFKPIRGKSCPNKTGSVIKRYRQNRGIKFPVALLRKTKIPPKLKSYKTIYFD